MPCSDSRDREYEAAVHKEHREIRAMLCGILTVLETKPSLTIDGVLQHFDEKKAGVSAGYIKQWWKAHKLEDEQAEKMRKEAIDRRYNELERQIEELKRQKDRL